MFAGTSLRHRGKFFGLHLASSIVVITVVLGGLYLGWYRWPGWYLTSALHIALLLVAVDVALGPLLTFLVANPAKPRRELARDVGVIVAVQLCALAYGTATLWHGRPLYYAFSEDRLQLVQASDLATSEIERARDENPAFAPYWHSRPRWVWAPLPADPAVRQRIVQSALHQGDDVIQMPRYFRRWEDGLPALRAKLLPLAAQADVRLYKKQQRLQEQMAQQGFDPAAPVTMLLTGRAPPLLAIFDPGSLAIRGYLRSDFTASRP
jgi:hypothetical protein